MKNLVIKNGKIVTSHGVTKTDLLLSEGKIAKIGRNCDQAGIVDITIDAQGQYILPGGVDAHAHIYDPDFLDHEDFRTGTASAAAGGITTVIEMVLKSPVDTKNRVLNKISVGQRDAFVDFSLHAGMINGNNVDRIEELADLGIASFKTFMCPPYSIDKNTLHLVMKKVAKVYGIVNVHAEDEKIIEELTRKFRGEGRIDVLAHAESRPNIAETKAVSAAIALSSITGAHLHFSHLSTAEGARLVGQAKRSGINVSAETCPHYLIFTREDLKKQGPYLKVNPSLKSRDDVDGLWVGVKNCTVDIVTSEHAPGTKAEKESGWTNIWEAWSGLPSIETMLPILLSEGVNKNRLMIEDVCRILCKRPAEIFGLYPRKGVIMVGSDADLTLVDLRRKRRVEAGELHYKCGWTPYDGMVLTGWPTLVICRGEIVSENGEVIGKSGFGSYIPRAVLPEKSFEANQ